MSSKNIKIYEDHLHLPFRHPGSCVIVGKGESGKTNACYDMVSKIMMTDKPFSAIRILSPTCKIQKYWKRFPDEMKVSNASDFASTIEGILEHQELALENGMENDDVLIIIDDCIGALGGKEGSNLKRLVLKLVTCCRNYHITTWLLSQTLKNDLMSNPTIRTNVNCVISTYLSDTSLDKLIDMIEMNKADGQQVTRKCWEVPFRFVCFDQRTSCKAEDRISFVRIDPAKMHKNFGIKLRD